jgi:hypothetical protein
MPLRWGIEFLRIDRSFQTDAHAKHARPEVGVASERLGEGRNQAPDASSEQVT